MLRDFRFLRRNAGKQNEEIENEVPPSLNPRDSITSQVSVDSSSSSSSRPPLNTIQEPNPNPRFGKSTPTKPRPKKSDSSLPFRTPDKHRSGSWSQRNNSESRDEVGLTNGCTTPWSTARTLGRGNSNYSESHSTQSTPTKSVSKPPVSRGKVDGSHGGGRGGNYTASYRGIPVSAGGGSISTVVNSVEVPHFDLKEDPSFWVDHNVQVLIRVRPLSSTEKSIQGYNRCLKQESAQSITWIGQPEARFTFDHVACETVAQDMLFRTACLPMVENCLSGYNSCMFAYGQTGSGKTYTMLGEIDNLDARPSPHRGMTPRIFEFLFARIQAEEESRKEERLKYNCKCSFLEIYNEQITDLLDPSSTNLLLRDDVKKGVYAENLTEFEVETVSDILKLLTQGSLNRKVAATNMNRESSRSHSVFTCVIESRWEKDSTTNLRFARLNLVDLAGSERQKSSGAEGERLKEAANINKSLSTLGHVIMILVDVANGRQRHVPYRDSKLTFLLQDSLGGNSKTMIIANVSPSICCAAETLNTLRFAQRAKLIQNNAVVNEDSTGDVTALQHQIQLLKEELSLLKRQNVSRSLAFVSTANDTPQVRDSVFRENMCEREQQLQVDGSLACESKGTVRMSTKQLKSLETTLAGALRREQMAETCIKKLEAEIEQLNRLVRQREEDTRSSKMMLRFREDKIQRMESLLGGSLPQDTYLLEENMALREEIQLLQAKVDKNPEVTRFALENIRLLDQLRRFQEFYEEGEREILLDEVSKLREQLVHYLDGKALPHNLPKINGHPQEAMCIGNDDSSLRLELKNALNELEKCRRSLNSCLEENQKLTREIDSLQSMIDNRTSTAQDEDRKFSAIKNEVDSMHDEEISDLQLQMMASRKQLSRKELVDYRSKQSMGDDSTLQIKLKRMQDSLEKAKKMNEWYQNDRTFQATSEEEMDEIRRQAEAETVEAIVSLQQELSILQQQVHDCDLKEMETKRTLVLLETEMKELQEKLHCLTDDNEQLSGKLKGKEEELRKVSNEWELLACEMTEILSDGQDALADASDQLDLISTSFPEKRIWISEQVGKLIRVISEKELLIEELGKCLEDANNKRNDIDCMLKSLRGAALVINEAHQQECDEKQKEITLLKSLLESKTSTIAELEDKVKVADLCASKASLCATAAFVVVNRMSEVNVNILHELKHKDVQLGESTDMNQRKDFLLSSQAAAIKVAEDERQCLTMELEKLKETCSELQWRLLEAEKHASYMEHKLEDLEENNISKTREKLNELKTGVSSLRSCMSIPLEHERDPEIDSGHKRADAGEDMTADMLDCTVDSCNENYNRTFKDACDRGITVILLKQELEAALKSLQEVKTEMAMLCSEKEERLLSEKHSQESLKCFTAHLLALQTAMSDFETQFERKIDSVNHKLQAFEQIVQETGISWCQTKEFLEMEVSDSKIIAAQKAAEVSCIFAKFEEAQDTMKEADIMINELMIANEAMKLDMERLKNIEITLANDRDMLLNEVNSLQSINSLKDLQIEDLEKQFGFSLMETNDLVIELEDTIGQIQTTFKENIMSVTCDFNSFKTVVLDLRKVVGSWLEDVWSELIVKDCAVSVLHLCHMGILLETLTGLNAENGLLQYGLCESNTIIADLREHNSKSSRELKMCRTLKGKLLADIKSSFDRISRKVEETGGLTSKITTFEKKIIDLQMQEEVMLQRSNYMASQLSILMKDLDFSNRNIAESLFDREKMMKDNGELLNSQAEAFIIDLCSKEIQSLVLASQLEEMYLQKSEVENEHIKCSSVLELLKEEMILLVVDGEFKQEILLAKNAEIALLLKEVAEYQSQAQHLLSRVTEMNEANRALELKVHQLNDVVCSNDVLKSELDEVLENKRGLLNQVQALEIECEKLLKDVKTKETALESSSARISILDQQNQKLLDDICLLETSLSTLQTDNKGAELNRIICLEEENKSLKDEVLKLKTENSLVLKDLEKSTTEMESSLSHKNISDVENKKLQERVFTLETLFASLKSDLEGKDAEGNELLRSQSVVMADLSSKGQDLQIFSEKINKIKNDNITLRNELMSNEKFIHEAVIMSSLNTKNCLDSAENVGIISHRLLNVLEKENNMVAEKIFDQLCETMEKTSKFVEEIQCLEGHAEGLVFENVKLQAELSRKDDILKGLLFDLSLIQESASNAQDQKDKIEQMMSSFEALEEELAIKSGELDKAVAHSQMLEAQLQEKIGVISTLELDFERQSKSLQMCTCENQELRIQIEDALAAKCSLEEELSERMNLTESLEMELSQIGNALGQMNSTIESLRKDLNELTTERDQLQVEIHILKEKLGNTHAWAEENEAIALEAQQIAESKKIYAEEKETEVKLLERSVEELECTVNVLENKVDILKGEADRQRLQREEIENELLTLNHQMQNVKSVDIDMKRVLEEKDKNMEETLKQLRIFERNVAEKDAEIAQCKAHISELNLHAEAQANEYKQKFKSLEAMAEQVKPEGHFFHAANSSYNKLDKNAAKSRGSGSPFKCIGLGLAQQIKSERDEELTAARFRIEELESLAVSRQKEVFALNARLAAAESMTHDVIRDLLGVKLDMTNYMSLLDNQQLQKIAEKAQLIDSEPQKKEQQEVMKLKRQLNEFIEERRGWLEEIDRKQAEMVAAQIALEKLRQRDQLLKTENEMLKMENVNNKKKLMEIEGEVKKLSGQQNIQQRIHHHAKIKEENNMLKIQNEDLSARLKRTEFMLSRVKDELAHYRASIGKTSDINFDEEQQLMDKLKETEEDRVQIAQKLFGLCTSILKAAGITKPVSSISPAAGEEALELMKNRITSLERECQDLTYMNRISNERIRLSELMPRPSPPSNSRMDENCQTPRRSQTSILSALER